MNDRYYVEASYCGGDYYGDVFFTDRPFTTIDNAKEFVNSYFIEYPDGNEATIYHCANNELTPILQRDDGEEWKEAVIRE